MFFFCEPGVAWALHLLAGQAQFGADSGLPALQAGDTAWLAAGEGSGMRSAVVASCWRYG
jgi:hypothetical protein